MACTRPLPCYKTPSGKIVFSPVQGAVPAQVPCGQCIGCRLAHSRDWATRCMHEAHMHESSSFITLTYSPEHLPENGSLVRKHFTDFLKRLRKALGSVKIRYFGCGEYGSKLERPHYHAIIVGLLLLLLVLSQLHTLRDIVLKKSMDPPPVSTMEIESPNFLL